MAARSRRDRSTKITLYSLLTAYRTVVRRERHEGGLAAGASISTVSKIDDPASTVLSDRMVIRRSEARYCSRQHTRIVVKMDPCGVSVMNACNPAATFVRAMLARHCATRVHVDLRALMRVRVSSLRLAARLETEWHMLVCSLLRRLPPPPRRW